MIKNDRFFYRSSEGLYVRPVWTHLSFYVVIFVLGGIISSLFLKIIQIDFLKFIENICILGFFVSLIALIWYVVWRSKKNQGVFRFLDMYALEESITQALVESMSLNRLKDVAYLRVPRVLCTWTEECIKVEIGKISGVEEKDLDKLREIIDSSLKYKYSNFAVSSELISDNKLEFVFYAEDVASDETWIPKTIADLKQKPYFLKLQNNLIINLADTPNIGIWGSTGSGKSTVVFACVAQLLSKYKGKNYTHTKLIFLDGKSEYSALSTFYPKGLFLTEADEIESTLKDLVENELPKRQQILKKATMKKKKLGLRGFDIGLQPLVIVADEIGNLAGSPKQRKSIGTLLTTILQRGRSISCFVIWATQDPAVSASMSVLSQGGMSQLSTKILLGTAKPEVQREVFGDIATTGDVPKFRGFYISGGKSEPQRFFVPNLYKYDLSELNTFEELYND